MTYSTETLTGRIGDGITGDNGMLGYTFTVNGKTVVVGYLASDGILAIKVSDAIFMYKKK